MAKSQIATLEDMLAMTHFVNCKEGLLSAEDMQYLEDVKAEQDEEAAYGRYVDYQAFLRDGWQPAHAF
jgi:hypothetical protein